MRGQRRTPTTRCATDVHRLERDVLPRGPVPSLVNYAVCALAHFDQALVPLHGRGNGRNRGRLLNTHAHSPPRPVPHHLVQGWFLFKGCSCLRSPMRGRGNATASLGIRSDQLWPVSPMVCTPTLFGSVFFPYIDCSWPWEGVHNRVHVLILVGCAPACRYLTRA